MHRALAAICILSVAACASREEQQQEKMQASLSRWANHSIAEYALNYGPPTANFEMGAGRRAFQWQITGQTAGAAIPINGMLIYRAPQQTSCMVSFVASTTSKAPTLADWMIGEWSWQGNC